MLLTASIRRKFHKEHSRSSRHLQQLLPTSGQLPGINFEERTMGICSYVSLKQYQDFPSNKCAENVN